MVAGPARSPHHDTVILLDISSADYEFSELEDRWPRILRGIACPCCRTVGRYGRHGSYHKYHWRKRVLVLRVRCRGCGVTHALLPSFSLPGTSIGTEEAERYLIARADGVARGRASAEMLSLGVGVDYPRRLERRLEVAVSRGKALFPDDGDLELQGLEWIRSLCGPVDRPLHAVNCYALARGVNGLCFCRSAILLFPRNGESGQFSHNRHSAAETLDSIDCW